MKVKNRLTCYPYTELNAKSSKQNKMEKYCLLSMNVGQLADLVFNFEK